jgi:hypothetical protein
MRPYVDSRCIFAVENGCAGPWNAAVLTRTLVPSTNQVRCPKNKDLRASAFVLCYGAPHSTGLSACLRGMTEKVSN